MTPISEVNTTFEAENTERNADVAERFAIQHYAVSCDSADGLKEHVSRGPSLLVRDI